MTSIASNLTTASGLRDLASGILNPGPVAQDDKAVDKFQASSPDKNRGAYEVAYNGVAVIDTLARTAGRAGQFYTVLGPLSGLPASGLAGVTALVGGTYDLAIGASVARQSAVNRNSKGAWTGNLQVLQGLATYAAVLAPSFGAPPAVGLAAAGVAAAAWAGRTGIGVASKIGGMIGGKEAKEPMAPIGPKPGEKYEEPQQSGNSRKYEKAFAFAQANDAFFRGLGGMGAFWTNIDGVRGLQPGGIFGILGFVGGTYSLISGVSTARASAINHNKAGTIDGTLQTVQGVATLATAMGLGRPAAAVAIGAWVARTAYMIYNQVKAISGDKEESAAASPVPPAASPAPAPPAEPATKSA